MANRSKSSQLTNWSTLMMYIRQFMTLAENVFQFKNLPKMINVPYLNKTLINKGAIAFFYDDVLETILALPFNSLGFIDVYGLPTKIQVYSRNGYTRVLNKNEFVIMYDNNGCYPLYLDVRQYAERYAIATRTIDVNIIQQRTPRVWQVPNGQEASLKRILEEVDSFSDSIKTYDNLNLEGIECVLQPSPFVADKVEEQKRAIKAEFLELIGISHVQYNKKERMITDEIVDSQGNTIASRFSRFEPRQKAVKEINEKFSQYLEKPIEVCYYDNIPSSTDDEEIIENEEVEKDEL